MAELGIVPRKRRALCGGRSSPVLLHEIRGQSSGTFCHGLSSWSRTLSLRIGVECGRSWARIEAGGSIYGGGDAASGSARNCGPRLQLYLAERHLEVDRGEQGQYSRETDRISSEYSSVLNLLEHVFTGEILEGQKRSGAGCAVLFVAIHGAVGVGGRSSGEHVLLRAIHGVQFGRTRARKRTIFG